MAYSSRSHTPHLDYAPGSDYYRSRAMALPQSNYAPALDGHGWQQQLQKYGDRMMTPRPVYDQYRSRTPMLVDEPDYTDPYYRSQMGADPYLTNTVTDEWGRARSPFVDDSGWPGPRPDYNTYGTAQPYYNSYDPLHQQVPYYPSDGFTSTDTTSSSDSPSITTTTTASPEVLDYSYGPIPSPMHGTYSEYGYDEYGHPYGRGRSHSRRGSRDSRYRCACGSKHCAECYERRRRHRRHHSRSRSYHRSSSRSRGRSSSVTVLRVNPGTAAVVVPPRRRSHSRSRSLFGRRSSSRSSKRVRFSGIQGTWTMPELKRLTKMVKHSMAPSWLNWRPRRHY